MSTKHTVSLNDGSSAPWLAFGTGTALYGKDAADFIRVAIENGITHLDGAQVYGNEESLGAGIKASGKLRSDLYITTKLNPRVPPGKTVKELLSESLAKLGVDYVDLFLIHSPGQARQEGKLKDLWKVMEGLYNEGLTKSIGVSNFQVKDLKEILDGASVIPAVNQIELHPYVWKANEAVVKFCTEQGIVTAAYGGQTPIVRAHHGPLTDALDSIRERLEKTRGQSVTLGQVLTKWLLQKNAVVVTTTSKPTRIKEFIDTEQVPDLTMKEIQAIEEAGSKMHKRVYMTHLFPVGE